MIEIKLCGLKEPSHIEVAFNLGIKYIGFVCGFFRKMERTDKVVFHESRCHALVTHGRWGMRDQHKK